MDLRPVDRRGLGEVVAWACSMAVVGVALIAGLVKTGEFNPVLLGSLSGLVTALVARGAQSASERSAREEIARQQENAARAYLEKAKAEADRAEDARLMIEESHRWPPKK